MSAEHRTEKKVSKPHWYEVWTDECPGCGRVATSRERHYGIEPPPKDKRYHYKQVWCGCCYE